ncbi:FkbM family methyltransferase [Mesorhizobium sp. M0977]|uniref:FkbM family methyltransferase n=1 Tax=Mesorhizobium sp. M0977 TaxID=2957039 RepID=UPI00333D5F16
MNYNNALKSFMRRVWHRPLHRADVIVPFKFLGTEYGGWPLLDATPQGSLVMSFGVGEDISFDVGVIEEFGCVVHAFDPTPKSVEWIKRQIVPSAFHFHQLGLADRDCVVDFFPPGNDQHVSFSAEPGLDGGAAPPFQGEVKRLSSIIHELGLPEPYALKMDIEGFEYDAIEDILSSSHRPCQFLVEFHHRRGRQGRAKTLHAVSRLRESGYKIFFISSTGREYGFVLGESID